MKTIGHLNIIFLIFCRRNLQVLNLEFLEFRILEILYFCKRICL